MLFILQVKVVIYINLKDKIFSLREYDVPWTMIDKVLELTPDQARNLARKDPRYTEIKNPNPHNKSDEFDKKFYRDDGAITSVIRKQLTIKPTLDNDELLTIHGFNPKEFRIRTVTSNEWTVTNKKGQRYYNVQSKIVAEPLTIEGLTVEEIAKVFEDIKPSKVELMIDEIPSNYLLINLFDMHFGLNTYEEYYGYLQRIKDYVMEGFEEILIIIGGDYLHVDNHSHTTAKGTYIDQVELEKMKLDGAQFLLDISKMCLEYSPTVKMMYLPGNHAPAQDHSLLFGMGVSKALDGIECDFSLEEFKHAWLGKHSIFAHHGDKIKGNKVLEIATGKYAKEWGSSQSRYYFSGHFHHENSIPRSVMQCYQVLSPSKASTHDKKNGFDIGERGIMLFVFDEEKRSNVIYV